MFFCSNILKILFFPLGDKDLRPTEFDVNMHAILKQPAAQNINVIAKKLSLINILYKSEKRG